MAITTYVKILSLCKYIGLRMNFHTPSSGNVFTCLYVDMYATVSAFEQVRHASLLLNRNKTTVLYLIKINAFARKYLLTRLAFAQASLSHSLALLSTFH